MTKITDIHGKQVEVECISCALEDGEITLPVGVVAQNDSFALEQDFEVPIPGFLVLRSRRHMYAVDEFTEAEQQDFLRLLVAARSALREAANVQTVYLVEEEDTTSSHFHLWMVPIYPWMTEKFGRGIAHVKESMNYAQTELKTPANLAEVQRVAKALQAKLA